MVGRLKTRADIYFDRRVPERLINALAPDGEFHELVPAPNDERGPLDLHLRGLGGDEGHATLYLGLTRVIDLHTDTRGLFRLTGQPGSRSKSVFKPIYEQFFDAHWTRWQSPRDLAESSAGRHEYLKRAIDIAEKRYLAKEGQLQASLSSWPDTALLIDRESVIGFGDAKTKERHFEDALEPVKKAGVSLRTGGHAWADVEIEAAGGSGTTSNRIKRFGGELDALAVDPHGRLLIIEAKHGSDTAGLGWTPAQVAIYLRLFRAWAEHDPDHAHVVLSGMIEQRVRIGLAGSSPASVAMPLELVPTIIVGDPVRNPKVANERMRDVRTALAGAGEELNSLEVWQVDEHLRLTNCGIGNLP